MGQSSKDTFATFTTQDFEEALISANAKEIHPRDSITIDISSQMNNSSVCNAANDAKFEVVNNAKNANIAMGDKSNHTANFESFGDKNMFNSTGSNTGGWNTKNRGSNLQSGNVGDNNDRTRISEKQGNDTMEKRNIVNLNLDASLKGSNFTDVGNGNSIELHVAGGKDNVVNIMIAMESENSTARDSGNNNVIRIYIGDITKEEMGNSIVVVPVN
jgi:hypothetical protein